METWLFYLFAGIAVLAALNVLVQQRVFYSALSLIACLASISGIYMLLDSPFIAAVQIIVYAGAIMVLFLFVIMLLDPYSASIMRDKRRYLAYVGVLLGAAAISLLYSFLRSFQPQSVPRTPASIVAGDSGSVKSIGTILFRDFLLPFEATSVLILVAIIGAVVLAKRKA